jgi:hypothetical protein
MEGASISENFIYNGEYLKGSNQLQDITYGTECKIINQDDDFFIRYIIRYSILEYFKLLTYNVGKTKKDQLDYNTLDSELILKYQDKNKKTTKLGIYEISENVLNLQDNYINLNKKSSIIEQIINKLNILNQSKYLNYYLNIKSIKNNLIHILKNSNDNNTSIRLIEDIITVNTKYNYSKISLLVLVITFFKFIMTDGDTKKENNFIKLIPNNYKTFIILSNLLLLITPIILWIKNSGCNYFKSLTQIKSLQFFITTYIVIIIYVLVYIIILYYIFVKIIYKKWVNYKHSLYNINQLYHLITFKNFILLMISYALYVIIDYNAFILLNNILNIIQKPILQGFDKNIGLMKTSLYKILGYTSLKNIQKIIKPLSISFIILIIYLLSSNWTASFLKLIDLEKLSSSYSEIIGSILFFILFIYIITWFYLTLNNNRSIYTILIGIITICSFYYGISAIYSYAFLANMLNNCKKVKFKKKINIENYDFQKILIENILKPGLPFILITIILYLYPKQNWKFLEKVLFFILITTYVLTNKFLNKGLNTLIIIFIFILILFKFPLILSLFK